MALDHPHLLAAEQFMRHKGYIHVDPVQVQRVEGQYQWYVSYSLEEGYLELAVSWSVDGGWLTTVWDFRLKD